MKALKFLFGSLLFVIGILMVLHFSDMNPLWYWNDYLEWMEKNLTFITPRNGIWFLFIVACAGVVLMTMGFKIIKTSEQES